MAAPAATAPAPAMVSMGVSQVLGIGSGSARGVLRAGLLRREGSVHAPPCVMYGCGRVVCRSLLVRRNLVAARGLRGSSSSALVGAKVRRFLLASRHLTSAVSVSTESAVSVKAYDSGVDNEDRESSQSVTTLQSPENESIGLKPPSLKPAPKPVVRPNGISRSEQAIPPLKPPPSPASRPNGIRNDEQGGGLGAGNDDSMTLKTPPRPVLRLNRSSPARPQQSQEGEIPSLGQILENVEKLGSNEARPATSAGAGGRGPVRARPVTTQPGAWRAGDKIRTKSERERDAAAAAAAAAPERRTESANKDEEQETSISMDSEIPKTQRPRVQLNTLAKPTVRPPPAASQRGPVLKDVGASGPALRDASAAPRKGPILKDVGSRGPILKDVGAAPRGQSSRVSTSPPANIGPSGPPKPFSKPAIKGKEDWRKKAASNVSDGAKRRVARKQDSLDGDMMGAKARRGGKKMTKASRKAIKMEAARAAAPVKAEILEVGPEGMSCQDLAAALALNDSEIVKVLFMKGIAITVNQTLDEDTVKLVCKEFEVEVVEAGTIRVEDLAKKSNTFIDDEDLEHLESRPPVVTIMGHVDHGKTSLLDFIRKTKVAAGEAGGITQGIGAYSVDVTVEGEVHPCVFLDTPGHEAFSAMRARGARVTDIAVVVVAADDGVRPQTLEAIAHAKAADVPIVIAINKIDKDGANADVVMQELSSHGLMPEEWGGDIPMVKVSAKKGTGVDSLLENVVLVAELQELSANPERTAKGTVIEASLDKARGPLATLLVQNGTLRKGDIVLCGETYGKVRALMDHTGARVDEARPSAAVQILGLNEVPVAGDEFEIFDSLDVARSKAQEHAEVMRQSRLAAQAGEGKVTLHSFANAVAASAETGVERHQLNVVLKVDAQGSVEAIREVLQQLPQDTVALRFLLQSTGEISASDVELAVASGAVVIGFNVGVQPSVKTQADAEGVEIRLYRVIYDLVDDIRKAMEGLLEDVEEELPIGEAEVRAVFGAGSGKAAGCMVTEGKLVKGSGIRVMRGNNSVHVGSINSLRRVKELAKEVPAGLECGVGALDFNEWQVGDKIMAFKLVAKKRTLEDASVTVNAAVNTLTLHNQ
ncbi:uncharacterized protein [Physcomitrium patens]|uniref:Translation initiation factor IF-2, chloroplastic n=1 Tax=Physcomitrium patens TaxID=3218 RepID=A0A2K1L9I7_PHYPA|nr:uncharacterized protein LOC112289389 [Physcomitrium patens]PNR62673.1 hypothetical protein PHYPA_001097 [Physcomitrium patens]|eukprot:XP_024390329.1 uncharacterized protein LOC112289389 [Physcomitrella patens]